LKEGGGRTERSWDGTFLQGSNFVATAYLFLIFLFALQIGSGGFASQYYLLSLFRHRFIFVCQWFSGGANLCIPMRFN